VSAGAVWLQVLRCLFAAWWLACGVVRNGAETGMWEPPDSWNEHQEMPVRTRSTGWLVWSLWALTMALEGAQLRRGRLPQEQRQEGRRRVPAGPYEDRRASCCRLIAEAPDGCSSGLA